MIHEFYAKLRQSPIAPMFTERSPEEAEDRSASFFIRVLGGDDRYHQVYGAPRMRARHLGFRITEAHRQIWLQLFFDVLDHPQGFTFPSQYKQEFKDYLDIFSRWMVNSSENSSEDSSEKSSENSSEDSSEKSSEDSF